VRAQHLLAAVATLHLAAAGAAAAPADPTGYAAVTAGTPLRFPRDYGSHPGFRTEWWYVTGWLTTQSGEPLGFQVTFFRTKPQIDDANPSAFAPHQLLIAHCAISDPKRGRLWQDQRIRRAGLGLADADENDAHVWIEGWSLQRGPDGRYRAQLAADDFGLDLTLTPTQPAMINGDSGVSRKGPMPEAASYYYSLPHMVVGGRIERHGAPSTVSGEAWFDHEWSSEYLDSKAVGWDWTGINLADGSGLMAFRIRGQDGATRWAGASLGRDGHVTAFDAAQVKFEPGREWISPRTGIKYPVTWRVEVGGRQFELRPLLDDQENDTRLSTGAIYWEGAVRAFEGGRAAGLGYLELTGYGQKLELR
jgi:predicted secreted hydrolase